MSKIPPLEWDLLLSSAQKNNPDMIRKLVLEQKVPPSHANGVGQSALHVAALWGHVEAVRTLLELGANPNAQNNMTDATPLHMVLQQRRAPLEQQEQVVDLLLLHGADCSVRDRFTCLPVDYLLQQPDIPSDHALIAKLQPQKPEIFGWVQECDLETFQQTICDMESSDAKNMCNQSYASQTPLTLIVDQIIATVSPEDENVPQEGENEALQERELLLSRQVEFFRQLVSMGACLPGTDQEYQIESGDNLDPPLFRILECLREAYKQDEAGRIVSLVESVAIKLAALESQNEKHSEKVEQNMARVLHAAARRNEIKMLIFLCSKLEWNVNMENGQGMTALQFAARSGKSEAVQVLLNELGADPNHQDGMGRTALQAAMSNHKQEVVDLLTRAASSS